MSNVEHNMKVVRDYCANYILSNDQLKQFQELFLTEMKQGLGKSSHHTADIKCHITYVTDLPDGTERGKYLALELNDNYFRVLMVDLIGEKNVKIISKIYLIPQSIMTDESNKLFDYIVNGLTHFISLHGLSGITLPLGFTFSFPINQVGLNIGLLIRWTKGFDCSGVVGKNVVELLDQAIKRKGIANIQTVALLNDTTGTLMSCALENSNCRIGLIIGTGCNACYLETVSEVKNWNSSVNDATHVIINCEFGAFGENGCIDSFRTEADRDIDDNSINKGEQLFEKMISGMYMGEIVRVIIIKLVKDEVLFNGFDSDMLNTFDVFKTDFIAEIESDAESTYTNCKLVLKRLHLDKRATDEDCKNILYICQCVSQRSAHLVSAVISALINKMDVPKVTVGVDGSVYRLHPHYHKLMVEKISELINPQLSFEVMLSDDGSGKGAAIIAAVATRKKK